MSGLTYNTFTTSLANMLVIPVNDAGYVAALPNIIDDAEQRLYRELNLLATVVRDASATLTANSRNFTLPTSLGRFVTVQGVNVITPVSASLSSGTRNSLSSAWRSLIDFLYPTETAPATPSVPTVWSMITDQSIIVGPAPDAAYKVEVIGTIRPTALSSGNQTTFLSQYEPDLFLAAAMVFSCGYQKNFSEMGDQPQSATAWEAHYQLLFKSADLEQLRARYNGTLSSQPSEPT